MEKRLSQRALVSRSVREPTNVLLCGVQSEKYRASLQPQNCHSHSATNHLQTIFSFLFSKPITRFLLPRPPHPPPPHKEPARRQKQRASKPRVNARERRRSRSIECVATCEVHPDSNKDTPRSFGFSFWRVPCCFFETTSTLRDETRGGVFFFLPREHRTFTHPTERTGHSMAWA